MIDPEFTPGFESRLRADMAMPALLFNIGETAIAGLRSHAAMKAAISEAGGRSVHTQHVRRFDMPDKSVPVGERISPVRTALFILKPRDVHEYGISTVALRIPTIPKNPGLIEVIPPAAFIDVIGDEYHDQTLVEPGKYFVNRKMVTRYTSAADIVVSNDGTEFNALNERFPEKIEVVEGLSRLISEAEFAIQTSGQDYK